MRTRRYNVVPTKTKVGVFTGGIKEDQAQLELNIGELIRGLNYQEIDGAYHGYMSMEGYEAYDGTQLASEVSAPILEDKGNDRYTTFLLDSSSSPSIVDLSREQSVITSYAIEASNLSVYNSYYTYSWYIGEGTVLDPLTIIDPDTLLDPDSLLESIHKDFSNKSFCIEGLSSFKTESDSTVYYLYKSENDLSLFLDKVTSKINLTIGLTYAIEFDTTIKYDTYIHWSLRRIGDNIYLEIDGVEDSSYLALAAGYIIPHTDSIFSINYTGWLSLYRISQGTYRRRYNNFIILDIPFSHFQYKFTEFLDQAREIRRGEIEPVGGAACIGYVKGVYKNYDDDVVYAVRQKEKKDSVWKSTGTSWSEITGALNLGSIYSFTTCRFDLLSGLQRLPIVYIASNASSPCYINPLTNTLVPITHADLPSDTHPTTIVEFKNRLWLGYEDGRLVFSNVGDPTDFDATTFSGMIYLEDKILNLEVSTGNTLIVFCENSIQIVKALSVSDTTTQVLTDYLFSNTTLISNIKNYKNSPKRVLDDIMYIDERGLTSLSSTDSYGDFETKSYSKYIKRTLSANINNIVGAFVNKKYNQYRVLFSNGLGIVFTFEMKSIANSMARLVKGATIFKYLTDVSCCNDGVFGDVMGYIYLIDSGTSYNGNEISTIMATPFYNYQSPAVIKHFKQLTLEGRIPYDTEFTIKANFDYRNINYIQSTETEDMIVSGGLGGYYDSGIYDSMRYSESENQLSTFYINSFGTNMSIYIESSNKYTDPYIFSTIVVQYSWNGRKI